MLLTICLVALLELFVIPRAFLIAVKEDPFFSLRKFILSIIFLELTTTEGLSTFESTFNSGGFATEGCLTFGDEGLF